MAGSPQANEAPWATSGSASRGLSASPEGILRYDTEENRRIRPRTSGGGDGGRDEPPHPMCARHALCLERESLTDGGSTGDRMDSPGPWGTGDVCDRAG